MYRVNIIYHGIPTLQLPWAASTRLISRPLTKSVRNSACSVFHRVNQNNRGPNPIPSPNTNPHPPKAGNTLVTPFVLRVSIDGDNRLLSGNTSTSLSIP